MSATAKVKPTVWGLLAEFKEPEDLIKAAQAARQAGYTKMDAYSPYPIEALSEAIEFRKTRIPLVVLIGGIIGCFGGFFMQWYAGVISYPLNVGGRPLNGWPMFIPVTFEVTILLAASAAVFGMLGLNGLPMPYHPVFNVPAFDRATRDRFFLCLESRDPKFDRDTAYRFLSGFQPYRVHDVPH